MILRRTVDPDRPLPEYGLDSLCIELRNLIETDRNPLAPKNVQRHGAAERSLSEQLAPGRRLKRRAVVTVRTFLPHTYSARAEIGAISE